MTEEIATPARVTEDYAQTRHITTRAGDKRGWEKLTVYEKEFRLGHLCSKARCTSTESTKEEIKRAFQRRDAAKEFDEGWIIINASWPGGADPGRVRVAGGGGSFADHERAAKQFWERIRQSMGTNDWMICRRVCGEGYKVAETVIAIEPGYRDSTLVRFREALDSLIEALEKCRK